MSRTCYHFGQWTLDEGRRELLRGAEPVHLSRKAFDFLDLLLAAQPNAVSKQEIQERLWPRTFVSEASLTKLMAEIRGALEDDPHDPRFIRTVHGFGYAFCGGATIEPPPGGVEEEAARAERSPYPGRAPFAEENAGSFFGREADVEALWEKLQRRKLLGLIGPSGVGKTSLLRAGVLPEAPAGWACILLTPGTRPCLSLARALVSRLSGEVKAIERLLSLGIDEIVAVVSEWRRRHGEALVVVDQLEELFTLNPPEVQAAFASCLGRLVAEADVHVLVSVRDDFLFPCHEHAGLSDVFAELMPLGPLKGEALERALVEPARREGYRFDDDSLVAELVSSVAGERGALPLLAFAAARLWEKRDRERMVLTRAAYAEIGGVAGALAQHAEATLERIAPERQTLVREIFRNLVTGQGTRAVIDRGELLSALPDRPTAEQALRQLVDARLLTTYEVEGRDNEPSHRRVEVVHESLLSAWPRLVRWQAQDEEGALLRDQLKQAAHLWDEKGRTNDLLWTGTAFREFALWRERYTGALTALEEDFARSMTEGARRKKRLARIAVAAVVLASAAVSITIAASRHQAVLARERAQAEARRAEASKLLALAQLRLEDDPTEALAFTTASLELTDMREARVFAMKVLWTAPPAFVLAGGTAARGAFFSRDRKWMAVGSHTPEVRVWREDGAGPIVLAGHESSGEGPVRAEWSSGGILVTGVPFYRRLAHLWSLPGAVLRRTIDFGGPTWWQVGRDRLFAQTLESGTHEKPGVVALRSWRLPDGEAEVLGRIDRAAEGISSIAFDPGGTGWLYTRGRAVLFRRWPRRGEGDRLLARHEADAVLAFSRNHQDQAFSYDESGEIRLWSFTPAGPRLIRTIWKPDTAPAASFVDPSGRWLVNRGLNQKEARVWDLAAWPAARPLRLRRSATWIFAENFFHPSGDWLVTSPDMAQLVFWPLGRRRPAVVDGCTALYVAASFSADGRWLASNWTDQNSPGWPSTPAVRLWPVPGSGVEAARRLDLPENIWWNHPVFDPKLRFLFLLGLRGGHGAEIGFLVPLDGSPHRELAKNPDDMMSAPWPAVSPSGHLAATAFFYGRGEKSLRIWNLETGDVRDLGLPVPPVASAGAQEPPSEPTGYEGGVISLGFVDDTTLITGGHGGIRRWNLGTGSHELVVPSGPGQATMMALGAGGRTALTFEKPLGPAPPGWCGRVALVDLVARRTLPLPQFGECGVLVALDPSGTVAATGDGEGVLRVGRVDGGEPHLLLGHERGIKSVAISPDLRWIASIGQDATLRLWPMPDLSKPPLHTLPRDELVAKLKSLTNLHAVGDAASSTGWKIEIGPFPGWKDVPTW